MELFWGDGLGEETQGLDILGIRGLEPIPGDSAREWDYYDLASRPVLYDPALADRRVLRRGEERGHDKLRDGSASQLYRSRGVFGACLYRYGPLRRGRQRRARFGELPGGDGEAPVGGCCSLPQGPWWFNPWNVFWAMPRPWPCE